MKRRVIAGSVKNWEERRHHTVIDLPACRWRQEFHGRVFDGGTCRLGEVLRTCPVRRLSNAE